MAQPNLLDLFEDIENIEPEAGTPRTQRTYTLRPGIITEFKLEDNRLVQIACEKLKLIRIRANKSARNVVATPENPDAEEITNVHVRHFFKGSLSVDGVEHPWFTTANTPKPRKIQGEVVMQPTPVIIDTQLWQTGVDQAQDLIRCTGLVRKAGLMNGDQLVHPFEKKFPGNFLYVWGPPQDDPRDRSNWGIPVEELQFQSTWSSSFPVNFKNFVDDLDESYERMQAAGKLKKTSPEGYEEKLKELRNGTIRSMLGSNFKGHPHEGQIQHLVMGGKKFTFWSNSDPATFNIRQAIAKQKIEKPKTLLDLEALSAAMDVAGGMTATTGTPAADEPGFGDNPAS